MDRSKVRSGVRALSQPIYQRTQFGRTMCLALTAVWLTIAAADAQQGLWALLAVTSVVMVGLLSVFSQMTVRVTEDEIEWWLGLKALRQTVPVDDVTEVSTRKVSLLQGLGIRTSNFRDWLWIIDGSDVVMIERRGGRHVGLGSDDVQHLVHAIRTARYGS